MTTLTVALSETLTAYLQEQITVGDYRPADAYIQPLIQQDKARKEHLEPLLAKGLESGDATPMTATDWTTMRAAVQQKQTSHPQHGSSD